MVHADLPPARVAGPGPADGARRRPGDLVDRNDLILSLWPNGNAHESTLRMHVTGTGNFDRVESSGLGSDGPWKTYEPKATFNPADPTGYRGLIGATPDGLSVVALRMHPQPGPWNELMKKFLGIEPGPDGISGTVMLHLRK